MQRAKKGQNKSLDQTSVLELHSWRPRCLLLLCHALTHSLKRVPRPGTNCRCTYELGRQLACSRRH